MSRYANETSLEQLFAHVACGRHDEAYKIIQKRIDEGKNLLIYDGKGENLPRMILEHGNEKLIRLFIESGYFDKKSTVEQDTGEYAIHKLLNRRLYKMIGLLVKRAPSCVNYENIDGETPLLMASDIKNVNESKATIHFLLNNGADASISSSFGTTIFHYLAKDEKKNPIFIYFAKQGLNINQKDKMGYSPYHYAYECSNFALIDLLVEFHFSTINSEVLLNAAIEFSDIDAISNILEISNALNFVNDEIEKILGALLIKSMKDGRKDIFQELLKVKVSSNFSEQAKRVFKEAVNTGNIDATKDIFSTFSSLIQYKISPESGILQSAILSKEIEIYSFLKSKFSPQQLFAYVVDKTPGSLAFATYSPISCAIMSKDKKLLDIVLQDSIQYFKSECVSDNFSFEISPAIATSHPIVVAFDYEQEWALETLFDSNIAISPTYFNSMLSKENINELKSNSIRELAYRNSIALDAYFKSNTVEHEEDLPLVSREQKTFF